MPKMSPIRIFHTLWTKPLREDRIPVTLLCYAISLHYARQMGAEVVLHTDKFGAELLALLPYDEVYIDLDAIPEDIKRFWAYGKLFATQREPLGSVHIDGDVFLRDRSLERLFRTDADLVTQSEEGGEWRTDYTYELSQAAINIEQLPNNVGLYYPLSYNCGVVQLNNRELKDRYLDTYFRTVEMSLADSSYEEREKMIKAKFGDRGSIIPDIVTEQQFLHELAQNYKTKTILTGDVRVDGIRKGYTHLCTAAKYEMQNEIEALLQQINPDLLKKIKKHKYYKPYSKNENVLGSYTKQVAR